MDSLTLLLLSVLPALVIVAGLSDLTTMKIPNWISGLLILGFFPSAFAVGLSPAEVGMNVAVAVGALLVGMGLFAGRIIGGGDAKLMAATCLWLGFGGAGTFLLYTGLFGGLLCLALIAARKSVVLPAHATPGWVATLMAPRGDLPYGVAICAGALAAFPSSPLLLTYAAG
ncbi:prepilin peptidase [Brevundimonas sp. AJA228-03]|uniref:A24 family peptidase n=1 Tax=Brevundimonas sp. AJA228-03 TaxID=2752515 RepID=UPI001ADFE544|nr:prepilin peptidase [Brevundimonas sp. AJA228-03]QTN19683.1 prepilin peptidase [Brevundimonas sp. AJA228-03]